jgi:hypothetical protein
MDACIFIMTINALMPVYAADHQTQVDQLSVGDKVCVTRIENGWTTVHWSSGNIGHTGYMQDLTIKQNAQPTEPTQREEEYTVPAPTPAPQEQPTPQQYRGQQAPNQDFVIRPTVFSMVCHPEQSQAYGVVYVNGHAAVIGGKTGHKTEYDVEEVKDNPGNHVFYVKMDRPDQNRTLFLAFDYSKRGNDVSAIRVMAPGGYDAKDKCFMDWDDSK